MFCYVNCYCLFGSFSLHYNHLVGEEKDGLLLRFFFICDMCAVCNGLFGLPLDIIDRLCPLVVALHGHFLYYTYG